MCGILGIAVPDVTAQDILLFQRLLMESRIRGLHATGLSYLEDNTIQTIKEPLGADRFLKKYTFADFVDADGSLNMIAHTRYSTSDLRYNQPIADSHLAVVHNGVISQELPENWPELYGAVGICETANDTELLFNTIQENLSPLVKWQQSSIAAIELHAIGILRAYRNGRRPMYWSQLQNKGQGSGYRGYIFSSTVDVIERSDINNQLGPAYRAHPNVYYTVQGEVFGTEPAYVQSIKDLQP